MVLCLILSPAFLTAVPAPWSLYTVTQAHSPGGTGPARHQTRGSAGAYRSRRRVGSLTLFPCKSSKPYLVNSRAHLLLLQAGVQPSLPLGSPPPRPQAELCAPQPHPVPLHPSSDHSVLSASPRFGWGQGLGPSMGRC